MGILEGREESFLTGIQLLGAELMNPCLQEHWELVSTKLSVVLQDVQLVEEYEHVRQVTSHGKQVEFWLLK
jgi:hypothetical protein